MKRTVWAVSSGSYSDYRVLRLFERQGDAKQHLDDSADDEAFIEEFDLWPPGEQPAKDEWWTVSIYIRVPDVVVPEIEAKPHVVFEEKKPERIGRPKVVQHGRPTLGGEPEVHIWAEGADKDAVIKAVKDRAVQVIATPSAARV